MSLSESGLELWEVCLAGKASIGIMTRFVASVNRHMRGCFAVNLAQ